MSDDTQEKKTGVLHSVTMFFERVLESKSSSNILIVVLIVLAALPLSTIAITVVRAAAPQAHASN